MPPTQWPPGSYLSGWTPKAELSTRLISLNCKMCNMPHAVGGMKNYQMIPSPGFVTPHGNKDKVATLSSHRLFPSWRLKRRGEAKFQRFFFVCIRPIHSPFRSLLMAFSSMNRWVLLRVWLRWISWQWGQRLSHSASHMSLSQWDSNLVKTMVVARNILQLRRV